MMHIARYTIPGREEAARTAARNNARLIRLRWIYMSVVAGVATATTVLSNNRQDEAIHYVVIFVAGLLLNSALFFLCRSSVKNLRIQQLLTFAQLTLDLAMAGMITFFDGGIDSRTTVLYVLPILTTALIFHGSLVLLISAMSGLIYVMSVLFEAFLTDRIQSWEVMVVPLMFYPIIFMVLGRLAMYLEHLGTIESSQKAYDSFLSLVAHQLKHPASAATTIIDAMRHNQTAQIDEQTKRYIEMLQTENENQIRLIDNLLEIAPHTRHTIERESVDVSALVEKIAQRSAVANDRVDDLRQTPGTLKHKKWRVSPIRLSLALTNVFDNAFRYSESGDTVSYEILETPDGLKLLIRDHGRGMDESEVAHQSDRLTKTGIRGMEKGHVGGLGVGLYAATQIISQHGGSLDIHSKSGLGTTVCILIPKEEK